jgi:hypothetical protein
VEVFEEAIAKGIDGKGVGLVADREGILRGDLFDAG